jgi:hypothetical protein
MRRIALVSVVSILGLAAAACGGNSMGDDDGDDAPPPDAAPPDADNAGWTRLIGRTWDIPSGVNDVYRCVGIMVTEDIYVTGFRSQAPLGSHHAVLTYSPDPGQLGEYNCSVGTLEFRMLYASGVGTDDLTFPADVGVRIPAGSYLHLNLHLFNASDDAINGDSAILIRTTPGAPGTLADMTFAGDVQLNIPAGATGWIEQGGCTLNRSYTVISLWPHMHQLATHQTLELTRGGQTMVLLDEDYSFSDQTNYPQATPIQFMSGDQVNVRCTFDNPGSTAVTWGDSSTEEMCFTGLYRYPSGGNLFECINGIPPL